MINDAKNKEIYGYTFDELSKFSEKPLVFICDFCNEEFIRSKVRITTSNSPPHCCGKMECKNKKKEQTCIKRYGYNNPLKNPEIYKKSQKTLKDKWGVDNISQHPNIIEQKRNTYRKKYNGKLISEWAQELNKSNTTLGQQIKKYGFEIALKINKRKSGLESKTEEILKSIHSDYIREYKIENKFADFLVSPNIIIEVNGHYWHCDKIIKDKYYHAKKRQLYINNNFIPLFFLEEEISYKAEIVKSIINNKLGKSNKIYARKCHIRNISNKDAKIFLNNNHLMGYGKGNNIGLIYNNDLVCLLQFINKKEYIEISRFCNINNHIVIGGFSKILKYIINIHHNKMISTFIDLRYGSGEYLQNLGFEKLKTYLSFRWVKDDKSFHRMKYPKNTGYEYRCYKLWDCGQVKYIKK